MPTPEETRRIQRVGVKIPLTIRIHPSMEKDFTLSQRELNLYTVDLSENGLGITSSVYIPEGIMLSIELDAKKMRPEKGENNNKIKLTGEIISCRMIAGQYRLGVLVKEINSEDKAAITNFIKQE